MVVPAPSQSGRRSSHSLVFKDQLESNPELEKLDQIVNDLKSAYGAPLTTSNKVTVMQLWNKVLAFSTAFSEALLLHWRILCAIEALDQKKQGFSAFSSVPESFLPSIEDRPVLKKDLSSRRSSLKKEKSVRIEAIEGTNKGMSAMELVESNKDPLYLALQDRMYDAEKLIMGLLDGAVRSLCPHTQMVQREAYRALSDDAKIQQPGEHSFLTLECHSVEDFLQLFARCGIKPTHWILFCDAFHWALSTHTPYAQEDDYDDLDVPQASAIVRCVAQTVAVPAVEEIRALKSMKDDPMFSKVLPRMWGRLSKEDKADLGEFFYRKLLAKHPDLLDYFSHTDLDSLSVHLVMSLDVIVESVSELGSGSESRFRQKLEHLGVIHRRMGVPTYSYALIGGMLIECLIPIFRAEEEFLDPTKEKKQFRTEISEDLPVRTETTSSNSSLDIGNGFSPKLQRWRSYREMVKDLSPDSNTKNHPGNNDSTTDYLSREDVESIRTAVDQISSRKLLVDDSPLVGQRVTVANLTTSFTRLYMEVMSIVYYPMLKQEKMISAAKEFYDTVKSELNWSDGFFKKRLLEIETEIASTGTYYQTAEELEIGARLAWRNSAKCIGRISWNTLMVRDMRHVVDPDEMFKDAEEHMRIATAGTNIQVSYCLQCPSYNT